MTNSDQNSSPIVGAVAPRSRLCAVTFLLVVVVLSVTGGYFIGERSTMSVASTQSIPTEPAATISLPEQYALSVMYGHIGPQLLDAGTIDLNRFVQIYQRAGQPLSDEQLSILSEGSDVPIVISRENAYFLLNFFWAFGLTNQNTILTNGPLMQYSDGQVEAFASTGGWTLGTLPVDQLYASVPLVQLTSQQQARLEEVAYAVYRPCCNNHTAFADCNHGMAMLGLLELMAAQNASVDEMFEAAKYVNSFWFPRQSAELASYFYANGSQDFTLIDAREAVGRNAFSSAGYQAVHQWLVTNNLLQQVPNGNNSCGV